MEFSEVPLFESEGNYVRLHTPGRQPLLLTTLNALEERLDPRWFFRANLQQLINLKFVDRIEPAPGAGLVLTMRNGSEVEMSRRQAQRFREAMSQ